MGFRFSRRIRIAPGIRLNLSKSGVSTSIGGRGAWFTFGRRSRATISLPGTGLCYSQTLGGPAPHPTRPAVPAMPSPAAPPSPDSPALALPAGATTPSRRPRLWFWLLLLLVAAPLAWALITM